jgi:hypothetical protein
MSTETIAIPKVQSIKHMAFAVRDAEAALKRYAQFLGVPADTPVVDYPRSRLDRGAGRRRASPYLLCG